MKKVSLVFLKVLSLISVFLLVQCTNENSVALAETATEPKNRVRAPVYINPDTSFHFFSAITEIFQDSRKAMWVGSARDGVTTFEKDKFIYFSQLDGRYALEIIDIQEDRQGVLWIQTKASLVRYNGQEMERFALDNGAKLTEVEEDKLTITREENWNVKESDLWFVAGSNGEVVRVRDGELRRLKIPDLGDAEVNYNPNWVFSIVQDEQNHLWLGTLDNGVVHFDGEKFLRIKTPEQKGATVSLFKDSKERLWFGTNKGEIFLYENGNVLNFGAHQNLFLINADLTPTGIWDITEDVAGNVWFATMFKGLLKYDGNSVSIIDMSTGLPSNTIQSLYASKNGNLWIGTRRGRLILYDGEAFTELNTNEVDPNGC